MTPSSTASTPTSQLMAWVRHWKLIAALVVGAVSGAAGLASWLGAQNSGPGLRITRLEAEVDSGFAVHDTLFKQQAADLAGVRAAITLYDDRIDLLLRMNCRQIREADLIRACDRQGARR